MTARQFFELLCELGTTLLWLGVVLLISLPLLAALVGSVFK